jgi:hypothetical protein
MKGYEEAGGKLYSGDFNKLKLAAGGLYLGAGLNEAESFADFADLTTELLDAAVALTHPDKHPANRKTEANRVTQELLKLKPFVFPAPPPLKPRDASLKDPPVASNDPSRSIDETLKSVFAYPCAACRDEVPAFYCNQCKVEYNKREQAERDEKNARQRKLYQIRKRELGACHHECATCGKEFKPKRADALYCSAACRQRAYVKRDGKPSNSKPLNPKQIEATIKATLLSDLDNAYTVDDLCDRVYPGLKRFQRKHRTAVIPAAKRVCERLGEHWDWWRSETQGGTLVFWNRTSVMSYGMARLKSDHLYGYRRGCTEAKLKASLLPGGRYHKYVVTGGAWWEHRQDDIAKSKSVTAV